MAQFLAPFAIAQAPQNYVIRPDDAIEIRVFQEDDLATRVRVDKDGNIVLPLIETVHVGGKTVLEATNLIKARYKDGYLVDPQINLVVSEFAKRYFTVLGEVQRPGSYEFPDYQKLDLLQAIGTAGGYTKYADSSRVTLKRKTADGEQIMRFDAKKMAKDHKLQVIEIQPNDIITIGETLF